MLQQSPICIYYIRGLSLRTTLNISRSVPFTLSLGLITAPELGPESGSSKHILKVVSQITTDLWVLGHEPHWFSKLDVWATHLYVLKRGLPREVWDSNTFLLRKKLQVSSSSLTLGHCAQGGLYGDIMSSFTTLMCYFFVICSICSCFRFFKQKNFPYVPRDSLCPW